MLLIKSQCLDEPIDIGELMSYSLTPVPHSLGTPDGFFNKTNKAAMLHYLIDDTPEEVVVPANSMYIQDGNALFHALKNLPPTFGEICLKVLDQMVAKTNFVFSTDSYHPDSIKSQERLRRGFSQRYIVMGRRQGNLLTSSCSLQTKTINCSSASYYYECGEARQRPLDLRNVDLPWQLWKARRTSWKLSKAM